MLTIYRSEALNKVLPPPLSRLCNSRRLIVFLIVVPTVVTRRYNNSSTDGPTQNPIQKSRRVSSIIANP
jgi:hypothetical protein